MKTTIITTALAATALAGAKVRRADSSSVQTIDGWQSLGCFSDNQLTRTLDVFGQGNDQVSGTQCQALCASKGYSFAGTEFSGQCYCSNTLNPVAYLKPDGECNMACTGDSSQVCGGADRINVFSTSPLPAPVDNTLGYKYAGCYSDHVAARGLSKRLDTAGGKDALTVKSCLVACKAKGYSLASVEYGAECYCDNFIQNKQQLIAEEKCNMGCNGDRSETCGGAAAMSLYTLGDNVPTFALITASAPVLPTNWVSKGCYTDAVHARALSSKYVLAPSDGMTVEFCVNSCAALNYTSAGVEYGGECYCSSQIDNGHTLASDSSTCNMGCSGNNGQTCGGPDRINIYSYQTPPPKAPGPAANLQYLGCSDNFWFYAGLNDMTGILTAEKCVAKCANSGAPHAGLWEGYRCLCGKSIGTIRPDEQCDIVCPGDAKQACGGTTNRVVVYSLASPA